MRRAEQEEAIGLRNFTDESGSRWLVWSVSPHFTPRAVDRRVQELPVAEERRQLFDRRTFDAPSEWSDGWLCFECEHEKRRLSPVPPNWEALPESELADLCKQATPIEQ